MQLCATVCNLYSVEYKWIKWPNALGSSLFVFSSWLVLPCRFCGKSDLCNSADPSFYCVVKWRHIWHRYCKYGTNMAQRIYMVYRNYCDVISTWWRQIWRRYGKYGSYGTVWHEYLAVVLYGVRQYLYDMSYDNTAWICRPILRFLLFVIALESVACFLVCLRF